MTLGRGEVAAIDVADSLSTLKRRWRVLVGAAIAGAIVGAVWTFFLTPVWEATADVPLGVVNGQPLEDAGVLVRFLAGPRVRTSINGMWLSRPNVKASVVIPVSYLRIQTRGETPQAARDEAKRVGDLVSGRHRTFYQQLTARYAEYLNGISQKANDLEATNRQIEASVATLARDANGDAVPGVLVLQQQIERNRARYLDLEREVRETQLREPINTRPTEAIGDIVVSDSPVWPGFPVFVAIGTIVGLAFGVAGVLVGAPSASVSRASAWR